LPNEVRHGIVGCWAELFLACLGGLEQHIGATIAVEFTCRLRRGCNIIASIKARLGDALDGAGPGFLHLLNFILGYDGI